MEWKEGVNLGNYDVFGQKLLNTQHLWAMHCRGGTNHPFQLGPLFKYREFLKFPDKSFGWFFWLEGADSECLVYPSLFQCIPLSSKSHPMLNRQAVEGASKNINWSRTHDLFQQHTLMQMSSWNQEYTPDRVRHYYEGWALQKIVPVIPLAI